jgi:hypothetical protein
LTFKHERGPKGSPSISIQRWDSLSPEEKAARIRALEVLRTMRKGHSFAFSCRYISIDPRAAKRQLGYYIYKRRRRWRAKKKDHLERAMLIYTKGRIRSVVINDSETASTIGKYLNDVKNMLISGNLGLIEKYRNIKVKDTGGKEHTLETKLEQIKEIELSREQAFLNDNIYDY